MIAAYYLDILYLEKPHVNKRPRLDTKEKEREQKKIKQEKSQKRKRETT